MTLNVDFDAEGRLFAVQPVRSSSGKLFVEDLDPRQTDEFLLGAAFEVRPGLSVRAYGRYREGSNFWEDVPTMPGCSPMRPQTSARSVCSFPTWMIAVGKSAAASSAGRVT